MNNAKTSLYRAALKTSAATFALSALLTTPTLAQEQAQANQENTAAADTIVVTGSRIARPDLSSASPLAVVADEEFKLSGTVNVEQVINNLPQVLPGVTAFSNNPGTGVATLNLRALGAPRTLVLVNGRRYMFYDTNQQVDLNTIPSFLLNSVDVVTGGASAVYGSDAVAGVVNFRLRNDLNGIEAGAQYSITDKGDGGRFNTNIAFGTDFADGAGHITAFAEYFERKSVFAGERGFSRNYFNATGSGPETRGILYPGGNTTTPQGRFYVPATRSLAGVALPLGQGTVFGDNGTLGATYRDPANGAVPFTTPDAYNFYPSNYLQVPQERWMLGAYGEYEINSAIKPYFEVNFVNNRVQNELAPTPLTGTFGIRTNNPFVTAADRAALALIDANELAYETARFAAATPAQRAAFTSSLVTVTRDAAGVATGVMADNIAQVEVARRMADVSARNVEHERNAFRVLLGTTGEVSENLTYDAYYMFSRTRNSMFQQGNVSRSAFRTNLLGTAANGGALDIFGPNSMTPEMVQAIAINATNLEESQLQVGQASISGGLFNLGLGADDVGFAFGGEWRQVSSNYSPDTALSSGDVVGFNAGQPTKGGYSVKELFGELLVPIVADRPFFENLTVRGAARYSDYSLSGVGTAFTWAAGAEWSPISDVALRGQFQRAIRAPNVEELFGGQAQGFPPATDPCGSLAPVANQTAAVRALCEATGVPAASVFTAAVQSNSQLEGRFGGNPDLGEETSDTYTLGAVIRPSFVPALNITVDYFNIKVDDYISQFGGGLNNTLNLCYNVFQDISTPYCQAIVGNRNPATGAIGGQYLPSILNANIGKLATSGVDLQVDYSTRMGFGLLGEESKLNFFFLGTWTEKMDITPIADQPDIVTHCAGNFGASCGNSVIGNPQPEYKFMSRLSWIDGPLTTSLRFRYVGKLRDERIENSNRSPANIGVPTLKEKGYVDLSFAYDINEHFSLTAGVNNLFDVTPTILPDQADQQSGTYPGVYDVLGRDFFISGTVRF